MAYDTVEQLGKSTIRHGSMNDRVFLEQLHHDDLEDIMLNVKQLANREQYGKILSKVPRWALDTFLEQGCRVEAEIPGLYGSGAVDGFFLAGYPDENRVERPPKEIRFIESVKSIAMATSNDSPKLPSKGYSFRRIGPDGLQELASLNKRVFPSYPYPIFNTDYLLHGQATNLDYYGLYHNEELLEAAILKLDKREAHAEIIDFVIPASQKGQNLSYHLLEFIKNEFKKQGINTIYSSIRATSYGLNITYRKQGFRYGGTLVNNTCIGGIIESTNIWYLHL